MAQTSTLTTILPTNSSHTDDSAGPRFVSNQTVSVSPDPVELTQEFVRLDIANPAGDELESIEYINGLFDGARIQNQGFAMGIQTYGLLTMPLPDTLDFVPVIHGPDELVPVDTINFGAAAF